MQKCSPSSCLLACVLGLNCSEAEVYLALLDKSFADVDEIAKTVGKDKTTVYRALQSLTEKGLVAKEYRILRSGGYKYIYKPIPIDDLKDIVMNRVELLLKELASKMENAKN